MDRREPLNVAVIGYGLAGSAFHAPVVDATPGLRLAAVVTSNRERAEQVRRTFPDAMVVPNAERLWDRAAELDLVVVASPNRTHVPLAAAALAANLPVVVDKPLAAAADQARRLAADARRRGLLLSAFQNRRWDGDFLTLQRLLADGRLGDVHRFESRFERWRPDPKPGWRQSADPDDAGGLLFDLGSHLIDQARVLFGPVTGVYAELERRYPEADVDDDTFVALEHASGVRSHLWMSSLAAHAGPRFRVLGSRAAFTKYGLDMQEDALGAGARPGQQGWGEEPAAMWGELAVGDERESVRTEPGDYRRYYQGIVRALRHGEPPPVEVGDAIAVLSIIEAARLSAHERRVVAPAEG